MMTSLEWLAWALALYLAGAALSLCLFRLESLVIPLNALLTALGGLCAIASALPVLRDNVTLTAAVATPFSAFAPLTLRLDALAALMMLIISLLTIVIALYSLAYLREYRRRAGFIGWFMNLLVAAMLALVCVDNAAYFIILFEAMTLCACALMLCGRNGEPGAGTGYFFSAHIGIVLVILAFWLLYRQSNSLDFADFRQLSLSASRASGVFVLAFAGFGVTAGLVPLHGWLPRGLPAAPSHASALLAGVMVKIGLFGIIKVAIDLLGATEIWWGVMVMLFGAASAVLGGLYGLAEHNIKRVLAYHTVENVGIILLGIGVGMVGIASRQPLLAALGLLGGLYHMLNHTVFKGLLFLGAGSVIYRLHIKDMERMGGLARLMPYTAVTFLIGCMAISALPPLNGFVSEWFTYQSLFMLSQDSRLPLRLVAPLIIVVLAIVGALAAMCCVKLYGITFSAAPRSAAAAEAREVPWAMRAATLLLALLCILLGLGASEVAPVILRVAVSLTGADALAVAQGGLLFPGSPDQTSLSMPLIFILLLALPILPVLIYLGAKGSRLAFRRHGTPWACGYAYENDMAVSAASFTQPLRVMFAPFYRLRAWRWPGVASSQDTHSSSAAGEHHDR
ncbi:MULTISPECIES: hydrogenase 4 subunit B [unclassified Brenneria]|uniref:hydrogenase 4 subunit B n=1 Tax=unclassified Brenneria TaxID=2634434 RepID=UPI001554576D|nr:hydrogenase 4 subunit B [Brenneria sp. hezel4-2-4]MEE3649846.1 hydrogenase 4 subunit B [Brenneria sp. HEZEL_4_2_4]